LEQTVQEIRRTRQGTTTSKSNEEISDPREDIEAETVYPGSSILIRDLAGDKASLERGTLLYEQTKLLMKQMWDDPYLFIRPAISTTIRSVPTKSGEPGSTVPDNTNGLDDPESMTTLIDPSEEGKTQSETSQVSIETQAPNTLCTLIHIYNDEEILEPAHSTPVRVQEEKGPKKTASPELEVQDKQALQKEIGFEGGLDKRESKK
jgi:hypothetical protein